MENEPVPEGQLALQGQLGTRLEFARTDKRALNTLLREYMPFIKKCVSSVFFKGQSKVDNLTDAMLAFAQSVQAYNPEHGAFIQYAAAFTLAAVLLVGLGVFIGISVVKGNVDTTPPAAGTADAGRGPAFTVEQAKSLRDDSPVVLIGKIERFLGDEKYTFTDDSGSIIIEIDNRLWKDLSIDQNDTVEITGELDKDFTRIEVEVSSIKIQN